MSHSTLPHLADPLVVVADLAVELARTGTAGLPGVLDALVAGTGVRSAVLRRAASSEVPGEVLAAGGERVRALPDRAARPFVVELPVYRPGRPAAPLAVLVVSGARPVLLPVLRAAAALLGLALAADAPGEPVLPAGALDALEHDRERLADRLHDGALQDLLVARLAADAAVRGGAPEATRDAVQHALVGLRRLLWHVRPRTEPDLPAALAALSRRLVEAGGLPLAVLGELPAVGLEPGVSGAAFRVVQAVALDAGPADRAVTVALRPEPASPGALVLDVDGGGPLADPDRWRARLRSVGGDLTRTADRLRVVLPVRDATANVRSSCAPPPLCRPAPLAVLLPAALTARLTPTKKATP